MSSIVTDQGIVHYESFGQGPPVILLHGWLGSWGIWQYAMANLGTAFRTYALDFWGFGESGKKHPQFTVDDFVSLVEQFMEQLGITRAPLVGHSMGGTVSLSVAIRFPERVSKVIVVGAPIVGGALSPLLRLAGYRPAAFLAHNVPGALRLGLRLFAPLITTPAREWYNMQERDLSRTTLESFLFSIASLRRTDLRPRLHEIGVPTLGIYGGGDNIVHPKQYEPLQAGVPQAEIKIMQNARHFPMLDQPDEFLHIVREFLARPEPLETVYPDGGL